MALILVACSEDAIDVIQTVDTGAVEPTEEAVADIPDEDPVGAVAPFGEEQPE